MVEALFETGPNLDFAVIAARAQERAGSRVDVIGKQEAHGFAFVEHEIAYSEQRVPMTVWLMPAGDRNAQADDWILKPLQQTWGWDDAESVVSRAPVALLVTDIMASGLDHRLRLPLYNAVLASVVELVNPAALHFARGERFVDPRAFLDDLASDPAAFSSTVNARYVTIADRPDEQLMDTAGMAPFGLPDVQIHFTTLEPNWVAGKILGVARYLFDNGDVIADGHTVPGLEAVERWPCAHEVSMMEPKREVLDIDPSPRGPARHVST